MAKQKMYKSRKKKTSWFKSTRGIAVIVVGIVILLTGSAFAYQHFNTNKGDSANNPSATANVEPIINYDPPTAADKNEVDQHKDEISKTPTAEPAPSGGNVTPVLTNIEYNSASSRVEASAFVPSINVSGGTCVLTLTKGSLSVSSAPVSASSNVSSTNCNNPMIVSRSSLEAGTWHAAVKYSSSAYSGTSQNAMEVVVQ